MIDGFDSDEDPYFEEPIDDSDADSDYIPQEDKRVGAEEDDGVDADADAEADVGEFE